jgi:hypothetical protein
VRLSTASHAADTREKSGTDLGDYRGGFSAAWVTNYECPTILFAFSYNKKAASMQVVADQKASPLVYRGKLRVTLAEISGDVSDFLLPLEEALHVYQLPVRAKIIARANKTIPCDALGRPVVLPEARRNDTPVRFCAIFFFFFFCEFIK